MFLFFFFFFPPSLSLSLSLSVSPFSLLFNLSYYLVHVNYMYLYLSYADVYSIGLLVNLLTSCICLFIVIQCTFIMIVNVFIPGPYWKPTFVEWATLVKYCE